MLSSPQQQESRPLIMTSVEKDNENFWVAGTFRRVVKRVDDAAHLLDDFGRLIDERASIEKKYSEMLSGWSRRWEDRILKGAEESSGTLKPGWEALLREAAGMSALHSGIEQDLMDVRSEVASWKKERFPKSLVGYKPTKTTASNFTKAQQPWAKLSDKMEKSRKQYFAASTTAYNLRQRLSAMEQDADTKAEDIIKIKERLGKARVSADQASEKYKGRVRTLQEDEERYVQAMSAEFVRNQDFEQSRMDFFKKSMGTYMAILAQAMPEERLVDSVNKYIRNINPDGDLVRYATRLGTGMPLYIPEYQEWSPGLTVKPSRRRNNSSNDDNDVTMRPVRVSKLNKVEDAAPQYQQQQQQQQQQAQAQPLATIMDDDDDVLNNSGHNDTASGEWFAAEAEGGEVEAPPPPPTTSPGRPMRALYEYQAEDTTDDGDEAEISFAQGDIITELSPEDDQGWARGMLADGTIGIYPAAYVVALNHDDDDDVEA